MVVNCDSSNDPDRHLLDESARRKMMRGTQEADRFVRRWLKGGILIDLMKTQVPGESESEPPVAQHRDRLANSLPDYSIQEEIAIKELHNLLIHRIYHEDNLLQMRSQRPPAKPEA